MIYHFLIVLILALDDSSIGIQNISLRNFLLEMLARTIAEEKRSQTKYENFFEKQNRIGFI
jgi:hypothetical protein